MNNESDTVETEGEVTQKEDELIPGVVVLRQPSDQPGQDTIQVLEINGLDPLAVPTLLRAAAKIKEEGLI